MKVILRGVVDNLGEAGEIKEVKKGFAINYLIPNKFAYPATDQNMKRFENEKKSIQKKAAKELQDASQIKEKIEQLSLNIQVKVGEDEKLFGSVTSQDIVDKLKDQGIIITKKDIVLEENIKALGIYNVPVKVAAGVDATLKVWIIKE